MDIKLIFCVLVLKPILIITSGDCGENGGSNFNLSVSSHRNQTGHWIVAVDLYKKDHHNGLDSRKPKQMDLLVGHSATTFDSTELVHISATATASGVTVPVDYEQFFGLGFYKLHTVALDWHRAQSKCLEEGAHLIIPNSAPETDVIKTFFSRRPTIVGFTTKQGHLCHVGFSDYQEEGEFISVLGTPLSKSGYFRWGSNQPSGGMMENCLVSDSEAIYWDAPCSWNLMFICEYKSK